MSSDGRKTKVEMSRGDVDWIPVRECFIRAFHRYPLYKYLIPDDSKREEFLRRYLEANYDVTVRQGRSILLAINLYKDVQSQDETATNSTERTVIGGVLFVPPARNGGGWEYANDEVYWEAYERYQLKEIDEKSLERVISYEEWETKNVTDKVSAAGIPLWNGLFCAIDPAHAGSGCGSMNYADCMKIMAQVHRRNQLESKKSERLSRAAVNTRKSPSEELMPTKNEYGILNRLSQLGTGKESQACPQKDNEKYAGFGLRLVHALSLLHHRPRNIPNGFTGKSMAKKRPLTTSNDPAIQSDKKEESEAMTLPMVVALSHSQRAVSFHKKNGFQLTGEVPFTTQSPTSDKTCPEISPFNVHVLIMDPFNTGMTDTVARAFEQSNQADDVTNSPSTAQNTVGGQCATELKSLKSTHNILKSAMGGVSPIPIR